MNCSLPDVSSTPHTPPLPPKPHPYPPTFSSPSSPFVHVTGGTIHLRIGSLHTSGPVSPPIPHLSPSRPLICSRATYATPLLLLLRFSTFCFYRHFFALSSRMIQLSAHRASTTWPPFLRPPDVPPLSGGTAGGGQTTGRVQPPGPGGGGGEGLNPLKASELDSISAE